LRLLWADIVKNIIDLCFLNISDLIIWIKILYKYCAVAGRTIPLALLYEKSLFYLLSKHKSNMLFC